MIPIANGTCALQHDCKHRKSISMIHRQWAEAPKWATGTAAHQKRCPCNRGPQWQFLLGLLVCWTWRKANFHFATRLSWPFNKHKCKYLQIASNDIHCNQRSTGNVGKAAKLGSFSWVVGDWCACKHGFRADKKTTRFQRPWSELPMHPSDVM